MFSIIIPTWNNLSYLKACIRSIRNNSSCEHDIVLHINDGSDGSLDWARQEGIRHTLSARNVGICLAVNEAAAQARADYIVYMNDDMYVLPGWDDALMRHIPGTPDAPYMLSGTMIEPRATGNPCVIVGHYGEDIDSFEEQRLLEQYQSLPHSDWSGASWPPTLVHRRWWHMVGGYSTELSPGMASDTDLAMKLWAAGCRVFHGVADSRIYHFQCRSTGRIAKNDAGAQFLAKWGITQSMFTQRYLRRGQRYEGPLPQPDAGQFGLWKANLKRRFGKQFTPFY